MPRQNVKALTMVADLGAGEHKRLRKASLKAHGSRGAGAVQPEVQDLDQSRRTEAGLGVRCDATVHRNRRVWRRSTSVQFPPVLGVSAGTASKNERSGAATWACRGAMHSTQFLVFARADRGGGATRAKLFIPPLFWLQGPSRFNLTQNTTHTTRASLSEKHGWVATGSSQSHRRMPLFGEKQPPMCANQPL